MSDRTLEESRRQYTKRYKTHPGSKSKIWKYFGFMEDENGDAIVTSDEAICELCDERVKRSSNTNLLTHLKRHHFIEHEEVVLAARREQSESPEEQSVDERDEDQTPT